MWDKVYQKLTDVEEETWLLRAVESTVAFFSTEVAKAEQLRFVFQYDMLETSASRSGPWRLWMALFQNAVRLGIPVFGDRGPPARISETCHRLSGAPCRSCAQDGE
jgi:hypothetical protein